MKKNLKILGEFVGHLAIGAAMFSALLLFGGAVSVMVHWATPMIHDEAFVGAMMLVDKVILYADVVFIVWWAVFSTYKAIKEISK
jgi:ABC-type uncharacterized transport system permease subunit